jgi:steroid delta-isomerase-like uncharacterized protein
MDRDFVESWGTNFLEAWNAHDVDAVLALCAEDLTLDDPALPETLHGHDGVRRFAEATFRAFPDFRIEGIEAPYLAPDGPRAVARWRMTGTMEGPWEFMGLPATGRRMDIRGVDIWEFEDERLHRYELVYDGLELAQQLRGSQ